MSTTTPTSARPLTEVQELVLDVLPAEGAWAEKDYLWLTDRTNRLIEFTDGRLEFLPMPTKHHQAIVRFLSFLLHAFIAPAGGAAYFAPLRLRIRPGKFREPDVILLKDTNDPRGQNRFFTGADLTMEVVSEDNPDRDLVDKRHDYAEGGVPEYWIVNPLNETITLLKLEGTSYAEHGVFARGQTAMAATLPGFQVSVGDVFDAK